MNAISKAIMDKSTILASYVSSISTAIGGLLSLNNIALLIGIVVTLGLGIVQYQVWNQRKKNEAEKKRQDDEYHAARMSVFKPNSPV